MGTPCEGPQKQPFPKTDRPSLVHVFNDTDEQMELCRSGGGAKCEILVNPNDTVEFMVENDKKIWIKSCGEEKGLYVSQFSTNNFIIYYGWKRTLTLLRVEGGPQWQYCQVFTDA